MRTTKRRVTGGLGMLCALLGGAACAHAQARALPMDDGGWEIQGDGTPGVVDGRAVLNLRQADVRRRGFVLSDGTVEFDMKVGDRRTFVGVKLRIGEDGTYEDVYFRPHKSGLPDAIQYNPAFRGVGQWQLHHGPEATAFAAYHPGAWQHVRIEVKGRQAAIFLGDATSPDLRVGRLHTGRSSGGFGFWASQPGATAADPWTVSLADVRVLPGVTTYDFPAPEPDAADAAVIRRWELSTPREGEAAELDALPQGLATSAWSHAEAAPSGLVSLDRELERPERGPALAFARFRLRARRARTVRLDLGYSDDATVFLDGRPIFTGRFSYSYNFPRRDGLITPDQATVHLALTPGEHDVVVAVSDVFGGWGLMGRIADRDGIEVIEP